MNGLALCAGVGGLELGLSLAIGPSYNTICYVEREAYAAASLVAAMEADILDQAPIWDDLATFDGRRWRGGVDIVSAGLPCQPYSCAGQKRGDADPRYLWRTFFRILDEVRPAVVFLENVPALLRWFRPIGTRLRDMGYHHTAGVYSAEEVGAPHRRDRLFVLAYRADGCDAELAHCSNNFGWCRKRGAQTEAGPTVQRGIGSPGVSPIVADSSMPRREGVISSTEWGPFPPGPRDPGWCDIDARLYPATESGFRGMADGTSRRTHRLRTCGNSVIPVVAAYAFCHLVRSARA